MDAIMHPDADDPIGKRLGFHFPQPSQPPGKHETTSPPTEQLENDQDRI